MYIQNYTWFVPLSYLSPIYISYIYLSVYLSTYLAIYLSICLSTVSIYLPSYLSVYLSIHRSIHPASYLSNLSLSLNLVQPNSTLSIPGDSYVLHISISTSQPIAQILRTLTRATRMDPHCLPGAWNMTAISDGWSAGMRRSRSAGWRWSLPMFTIWLWLTWPWKITHKWRF